MRRLRHVRDVVLAQGTAAWPLSDTQNLVELRRNAAQTGWDPQFQSGTDVNALSIIEIPIEPNFDYCLLRFSGEVISQALKPASGPPAFDPAHEFNPGEGFLYGWAWGQARDITTVPEFPQGSTTKLDAWAAQACGIVCQVPQSQPPFFGYVSSALSTTSTQRLVPQGFPINLSSSLQFNSTVGDEFSIAFPVGRLRMGELSVSGLQRLFVRFACTNPTLNLYDPGFDYYNFGLTLVAHFYEVAERDPR